MQVLESEIEAKAVKFAHSYECLAMKVKQARGWPDRLFILPKGTHVWVEFKRPGGELSKLQEYWIGELLAKGAKVYVCNDLDDFKRFLKAEMAAEALPATCPPTNDAARQRWSVLRPWPRKNLDLFESV